ncbi:MAG: RIP metalloprotease RseP [Alphaproteobacteria bacterium]
MGFEWLLTYVLPFLVILSVVVFVHELGHYLVAKANGVKVEVFSIGFGQEIFGFDDKSGTRWKFSWIPLGGYVKMFSDENAASQPSEDAISKMTDEEKKGSLFHKTVWQRMAVSAAGPAANYIFAVFVLGLLYTFSGQRVPADVAKIGIVAVGSAAEQGGLKTDLVINTFDGVPVSSFEELVKVVRERPGKESVVTATDPESGQIDQFMITPTPTEERDEDGNTVTVGKLGVSQGVVLEKRNILVSWWYGAKDCVRVTVGTLKAVGQMIAGTRSTDGLSGPIGIAQMTGQVASADLAAFFWFMAFLSINLGLINLFPIPVLDGGHLLFYSIEAVRGKPLSLKAQEIGYRIGGTFVLGLVLLTTWNDLARLDVVSSVKGWFGL